MKIEIYIHGGHPEEPDYTLEIGEDRTGEGWDEIWANGRIEQAGRDGVLEVSPDLWMPMHRINFLKVVRK